MILIKPMSRHQSKHCGYLPPSDGIYEHIRFSGMQDASLILTEGDPRWAEFAAEQTRLERLKRNQDYTTGTLEIDTDNLPDLIGSSDPDAQMVMSALYRLGAYQ